MADWHLRDLERRLAERGWRIVGVYQGDGYEISGTWELEERSGRQRILLDFEGLTEEGVALPIDRAYGCHVRGRDDLGVYFGKLASRSRPRGSWERNVDAFLVAL